MFLRSSTEQEGEISTPNVQKLSSDLRPLMFWMSNATELLNFFQVKVEVMEKEWEFEGEGDQKKMSIYDSDSLVWLWKQLRGLWWCWLCFGSPWRSGSDGWYGHLFRSPGTAGWRDHAHLPAVCLSPYQGKTHSLTSSSFSCRITRKPINQIDNSQLMHAIH